MQFNVQQENRGCIADFCVALQNACSKMCNQIRFYRAPELIFINHVIWKMKWQKVMV